MARRVDQLGLATLALVALVAVAANWVWRGGHQGELIEIERVEPLSAQYRVDINQAEWPELEQLPDIGETLARRIVESREAEGNYLDHDELQRVRGIGPLTVERIKPYLLPLPSGGAVAEQ